MGHLDSFGEENGNDSGKRTLKVAWGYKYTYECSKYGHVKETHIFKVFIFLDQDYIEHYHRF